MIYFVLIVMLIGRCYATITWSIQHLTFNGFRKQGGKWVSFILPQCIWQWHIYWPPFMLLSFDEWVSIQFLHMITIVLSLLLILIFLCVCICYIQMHDEYRWICSCRLSVISGHTCKRLHIMLCCTLYMHYHNFFCSHPSIIIASLFVNVSFV